MLTQFWKGVGYFYTRSSVWSGYLWRGACVMIVLLSVAGCRLPATPQTISEALETVEQKSDSCLDVQASSLNTAKGEYFLGTDPTVSMNSEAQQYYEKGLVYAGQIGSNPLVEQLINPKPVWEMPKVEWASNPAGAAYDSFSNAIKLDSDFAGAYFMRVQMSYALEKNEEDMLADLDTAAKLRPDYILVWQERANVLFQMMRAAEALDSLECALKIDPDYVSAHLSRGLYYSGTSEWEKAIPDLSNAIDHLPDGTPQTLEVLGYANRANAYMNLAQWENAAKDFTRLIKLDDTNVTSWVNRAVARVNLHDAEGALADLDHALEMDLSTMNSVKELLPQLQELMATIDNESKVYAGLKGLVERAAHTAEEAHAYFEEGVKLLKEGNEEVDFLGNNKQKIGLAVENFSNAIALDPSVADYFYQRALAYMARGAQPESIIADLDKAVALDDQNADAYFYRANYMLDKGDDVRAEPDLDRVIELNPHHFEAYVLRSRLHFRHEEADAGFSDVVSALENMPENMNVNLEYELLDHRAAMYYDQKDWQKAVSDLSRLIEIEPQPANYYARGKVYIALDNAEAAVADFNQLMELKPEYTSAVQSILPELEGLLATLSPDAPGYKELEELVHNVSPGGIAERCANIELDTAGMLEFGQAFAGIQGEPEWNDDTIYIFETAADHITNLAECTPETLDPNFPTVFSNLLKESLKKLEPDSDIYLRMEAVINKLDDAASALQPPTDTQ